MSHPAPRWFSWDRVGLLAACAMAATLTFSRAAFNLFAGLLILSWLLSGRYRLSLNQLAASRPLLLALLLYGWILVSMSYSPASGSTLGREATGYAKLLLLPLIVAFLDSRERVRAFWFAALGSLVFLQVLYLYNTWRPLSWAAGAADGTPGVFDNYIVEGLYLGCLALFSFACAVARLYQRAWSGLAFLALGLVAAYTVGFINPGRGAQLALVASLLLAAVLFAPPGKKAWVGVLSLVILLAVSSQSSVMVERFKVAIKEVATGDTAPSASGGVRLAAWEVGLKVWREHPLLGQAGCADNPVCIQPHNQYVLFLAEQGLVGCLLFALLLIAIARPGLRTGGAYTDRVAAGFAVLFAVHCLFDSGVRVDKQMFPFVIIASGLIAAHLLSGKRGGAQRQIP